MSATKVRNAIVSIEVRMKELAIETVKGHYMCLTVDHWTSKANQNNTGMTAHFIGSS